MQANQDITTVALTDLLTHSLISMIGTYAAFDPQGLKTTVNLQVSEEPEGNFKFSLSSDFLISLKEPTYDLEKKAICFRALLDNKDLRVILFTKCSQEALRDKIELVK